MDETERPTTSTLGSHPDGDAPVDPDVDASGEVTATPRPADVSDGAGEPSVPDPDADRGNEWWTRTLPDWLFVAGVIVTIPLVLFHFAKHNWFLRDEWFLLTRSGFPDLLEPNAGAHWIMVPRLMYWAFWEIWGITTYRPYAIANLALHLTVVVMLRSVIRRSGASPWFATAAAAPMLLFGPGEQGIVLAFQVGFTGSIAWGLVQLVLSDTEGGLKRRDFVALGAGFLAITSSGVGVTTTLAVGIALLLRRGWRMAAFHTVPLGLTYGTWLLVQDVSTAPVGRPSLSTLLAWDRSALTGTFVGIGNFAAIAWAIVLVIVVGAALVLGPWRDVPWSEVRRQFAMPVALFVSMLFFVNSTAMGRWYAGEAAARASRYVYLQAAFTLPLVAICAQTIARRWRLLTPVLIGLLLVPIPFNLDGFNSTFFGEGYFKRREHVLTTAVRMPFATEVPRSVRPVPDAYDSEGLNIGFLLDAVAEGRMHPSTIPITPMIENEFRVRLGFSQSDQLPRVPPIMCPEVETYDLSPRRGDEVRIHGPVHVTTIDRPGGEATSPPVSFDTNQNGTTFTAELDDLDLRVVPAPGQPTFRICPDG